MLNTLKNGLISDGFISGSYRLREPMCCEAKDGRMCVRFRLEDISASIYAYSWRDDILSSPLIRDLSRIYMEGLVRSRLTDQVIDIRHLMPARVGLGDVVRMIPQSLCTHPWLLHHLASAVGLLTIESLQYFVLSKLPGDKNNMQSITALPCCPSECLTRS